MTPPDPQPDQRPTLTFRVTQRFDGGHATGKIRLSTETAERPYPVSRKQAQSCAEEHGYDPNVDERVQALFERKLIDNRRDPCDDVETYATAEGFDFIRAAVLAAVPPAPEPTNGEAG